MRRREPDELTDREREVLELLRRDFTNEQIARRLGISLDGAKYHVSQILSKLGVTSREEAAAVALGERRAWWARWPLWAKIAGGVTVAVAVAGLGLLAWGVVRTDGDASGEGPRREDGPIGGPREGVAYCVQAVGIDSEVERQLQVVVEESLPQVDQVRASLTANDNVPETVDIGCPAGPEILVQRCPPHDGTDDFRSLCPRIVEEAGHYELFIYILPQPDVDRLTTRTSRITTEEVITTWDTATGTSMGLFIGDEEVMDTAFVRYWLYQVAGFRCFVPPEQMPSLPTPAPWACP